MSAPALSLPDLNKPLQLFVAENACVAKGVLTQTQTMEEACCLPVQTIGPNSSRLARLP